jgi:hypothetical protein
MKFAGKAFVAGMFGTLGVSVAVLAAAAILTKVGERAIRHAMSEYTAAYEGFRVEREAGA